MTKTDNPNREELEPDDPRLVPSYWEIERRVIALFGQGLKPKRSPNEVYRAWTNQDHNYAEAFRGAYLEHKDDTPESLLQITLDSVVPCSPRKD